MLDVLSKYTGVQRPRTTTRCSSASALDAVVIATPDHAHFPMVKAALERGLHVFCEKPLTLSVAESTRARRRLPAARGLSPRSATTTGSSRPSPRRSACSTLGAIGEVSHALAEAYGPVVLRPKGGTWRSRRSEGGGCLYDYAAHPLDLLTWYLGEPSPVGGTVLGKRLLRRHRGRGLLHALLPGTVSAPSSR